MQKAANKMQYITFPRYTLNEIEKPPKAVFICAECGRDIPEGYDVWHIGGKDYCERCIAAAHNVAAQRI